APVRVSPVSTLRAVTVAPGMIAPLESFTAPVIWAFWAWTAGVRTSEKTNTANAATHVRMQPSSWVLAAGFYAVQNKRAPRDCGAPLLHWSGSPSIHGALP